MDLNLLTVFDALLEAGSVSGAAERLHLTQPAMSRALGRLRRATGDQILVRSGRAMVPTSRAIALRAEVRELVERAEATLAPEQEVDVANVQRTLTLVANDVITTALSTSLVARIAEQAPNARLRFLPETVTDSTDLRDGRIDMAISAQTPSQADFCHQTLGTDHLVAVTRKGHPLKKLTMQNYASARHVTISRRGRLSDPIDDILTTHGLRRHVAASLPTNHAALHMVAHTDVVAAVPKRMSACTITDLDLRTMRFPFDLEPAPIILTWHQRYQDDPVHRWLRDHVAVAVSETQG